MKIVQATQSVAGFGNHNYLVLVGDTGRVMGQLHGWQVINGQVNVTGIGGELGVRTDHVYAYSASTPQAVLFEGSAEVANQLWQAALDCGNEINSLGYSYNALNSFGGHNSNAAFSTLAECMLLQPVDPFGLDPGLGDIILSEEAMDAIRALNDIDDDDIYLENPAFVAPVPSQISLTGVPNMTLTPEFY